MGRTGSICICTCSLRTQYEVGGPLMSSTSGKVELCRISPKDDLQAVDGDLPGNGANAMSDCQPGAFLAWQLSQTLHIVNGSLFLRAGDIHGFDYFEYSENPQVWRVSGSLTSSLLQRCFNVPCFIYLCLLQFSGAI